MKNLNEYKSIQEMLEDIEQLPTGILFITNKLVNKYISQGMFDVVSERISQEVENHYSEESDDHQNQLQLLIAAVSYCLYPPDNDLERNAMTTFFYPATESTGDIKRVSEQLWPWDSNTFKPRDRRNNLVRAAALIMAEIDRMDRLSEKEERNKILKEIEEEKNSKQKNQEETTKPE